MNRLLADWDRMDTEPDNRHWNELQARMKRARAFVSENVNKINRSINWWGLLGLILCAVSAIAVIAAIGEAINAGTGVVK